MRILTLH